ncbi:hypothetical protein GCM10011341_25880 [Frigidibacter albus]|nr:hypothetical protein GCM10011341_25880 [Frigidibacter albus]
MIRLRRAALVMPEHPSLELRGTRDGGIRATGVGFRATVGGDLAHEIQTGDEEAAARLSAVLAAANLAPPPEEGHEMGFGFG